ncbi:DUF4595 domain-containing protein [Dyadobacter chenwenxiniae]|uniref:DUF4595 domain-containing protein n=1 Tax=Dyadobacter chenwenxiniae TaxID=2906456 RepID=A0A9X1PSI2_9BACT|nr:DUF4595 domain-containing protein [Dyadobacter chenwenxiniae]MCF0065264.1 DUF4595 domain-containing protein [Dyadobacter chenwenxiniae]UON84468.1 DUF4595 domain-containing protein [Dyadobacter chenwenxiniae]
MKRLFKKIVLLSGLACGLFLVSCQDESRVATVQPAAGEQVISQAPPLMTPSFRLTKAGDETLTYNADGRIKQVNRPAAPNSGYSAYRTDYEYSNNAIVVTHYLDNVKEKKMEWQLENGHASKLKVTEYKAGGVNVLSTMHAAYQYNGQGQLVKVILMDKVLKTVTVSYDNLGNAVKFALVNNTENGDEFVNMMRYEYTEYVGGPLELDKGETLPMHVFGQETIGWIGDPYLPIFGKFGKNRLKKSIRTHYPATYKYTYNLDANGYVKEQTKWTKKGEFVESKQLTYAIPTKNRF